MFIQALVLKAVALQGMGKPEEALVALGEALARAEPEGYVRTFLDAGEPVARLLRRAAARGVGGADAGKLLALFGPDGANAVATPASRDPAPDLIEPLSARELEVLHLVAEGLANREIAERLVVSLPTVKKHVENIHGKLGVRSRTQAVARARSLNLL
jgi:LuxR family maltose regulon positive regulatory protein